MESNLDPPPGSQIVANQSQSSCDGSLGEESHESNRSNTMVNSPSASVTYSGYNNDLNDPPNFSQATLSSTQDNTCVEQNGITSSDYVNYNTRSAASLYGDVSDWIPGSGNYQIHRNNNPQHDEMRKKLLKNLNTFKWVTINPDLGFRDVRFYCLRAVKPGHEDLQRNRQVGLYCIYEIGPQGETPMQTTGDEFVTRITIIRGDLLLCVPSPFRGRKVDVNDSIILPHSFSYQLKSRSFVDPSYAYIQVQPITDNISGLLNNPVYQMTHPHPLLTTTTTTSYHAAVNSENVPPVPNVATCSTVNSLPDHIILPRNAILTMEEDDDDKDLNEEVTKLIENNTSSQDSLS